jgi:hypothetical protein
MGVFDSKQKKQQILKKLIITLVFKKNANFFRWKLGKITENCHHNIDPSSMGDRGFDFLHVGPGDYDTVRVPILE